MRKYTYWITNLDTMGSELTLHQTTNRRTAERELKKLLASYKHSGDIWDWEKPSYYQTFTLYVLRINRKGKLLNTMGAIKSKS